MECMVEGCHREALARGFCSKHYKQMLRNGHINKEKPPHCTMEGCTAKVFAKGLCRKHYNQLYYERNKE